MVYSLKNTSRRRILISLTSPEFHRKRWGFKRIQVNTFEHDRTTGARGILERRKSCPGVLTLYAGETIEGLPFEILRVHDVQKFVALGVLRVEAQAEPESASKPSSGKKKVSKGTARASLRRASSN